MKDADFPSLYNSANELSAKCQTKFFATLFLHLLFLALAAAASVINSPDWRAAIAQAIILIGALACSIYLAACRPEKYWYGARAVAESVKTLSWKFACKSEPFDVDDATAEAGFREKLKSVVSQNLDVSKKLTRYLGGALVSAEMSRWRSESVAARKKMYVEFRVQDQMNWYADKARRNEHRSAIYFALLISANVIAVCLALARIQFPAEPYWPTDFFVAVAACILSWMQARRFSDLSSSYALTAHEIGFINEQAGRLKDEEQAFSVFVADAENAFSREHTQWVARRDS